MKKGSFLVALVALFGFSACNGDSGSPQERIAKIQEECAEGRWGGHFAGEAGEKVYAKCANKCNKGDGDYCYVMAKSWEGAEKQDVGDWKDSTAQMEIYHKKACDLGHAESCQEYKKLYAFFEDKIDRSNIKAGYYTIDDDVEKDYYDSAVMCVKFDASDGFINVRNTPKGAIIGKILGTEMAQGGEIEPSRVDRQTFIHIMFDAHNGKNRWIPIEYYPPKQKKVLLGYIHTSTIKSTCGDF